MTVGNKYVWLVYVPPKFEMQAAFLPSDLLFGGFKNSLKLYCFFRLKGHAYNSDEHRILGGLMYYVRKADSIKKLLYKRLFGYGNEGRDNLKIKTRR